MPEKVRQANQLHWSRSFYKLTHYMKVHLPGFSDRKYEYIQIC